MHKGKLMFTAMSTVKSGQKADCSDYLENTKNDPHLYVSFAKC